MIVPFPAGGSADLPGRAVAAGLSEALGQTVLIDSRAGANTIAGAELAVHAAADGYTLLLAPLSTLAVNPNAYKKLPYDAQQGFAPLAKVASNYQVIAARTSFAPNTLAELGAPAEAKPGTD